MFGLITFIAKLLLRSKPSLTPAHAKRLSKYGLIAAAVALAIAAFIAWNAWDNHRAVEQANAKRITAEAKATVEAERRATRNDAIREMSRRSASDETKQEMKDAEANDPEGAIAPAGPVSRAAANRLPTR